MSRKTLFAGCSAHFIQDGLVALQYVLLPILAQQFNLNYAQVGFLRAVGHSAMTILEVPAGMLAEKFGEPKLMVFGLLCAGAGYLGIAHAGSFVLLAAYMLLAGVGAGFQHSLSSSLIVRAYDKGGRRHAMGIYNSTGDAGKLTYTGLFGLAIGAGMSWSMTVVALAATAVLAAFLVWHLLGKNHHLAAAERGRGDSESSQGGWGITAPARFTALAVLVFLDSIIQAVFLTFLAFVVLENGFSESIASMSVVLALVGGMLGKFAAGRLAGRQGDRSAFITLQLLTVAGLSALVLINSIALLVLLPLIGLLVQGTSTVTYGSVPDFVNEHRHSRGYALIYTVSSSSSVVGPFLAGAIADAWSLDLVVWGLAVIALVSVPLGLVLGNHRHG